LVLGDELPDDLQILPKPEAVRAGMQGCAPSDAPSVGPQEPHVNARNSEDAYKACNRARVQEGIKNPPPPLDSELGEPSNPEDDIIEEVRALLAQDAAEEK
jgi:hypothetical protein